MARKTIFQRIQLEGSEAIKRDLEAMGDAGEKAFRDLQKAANPSQGFGDKLVASLQKIQKELKKVGDAFKRAGKSITDAGKTISTRVTVPIVGLGGLILKVAGDFEAAMNQVQAVSGATAEEFHALREQAKELGATTQFSASEAAEAMNFLAMAGMEVNDILAAMPKTLQLASAAQLDMASAADIVTNILAGYNKGVDELSHVTDVLVKSFTSANTDLRGLAEAMMYAGPVASAAGVNFEEAAAALSLMGNAGIQGSMAGTSLRGAISRILNPTKGMADAMQSAGLSFTDAGGRLLPLADIIQQLEPHAENAGLFMELFGQRAGPAMAALVTQGSDAVRNLTGELVNSTGTAERVSKVQMEGFNGAIKELKSAVEGLQIAIADSGLLEWVTDLVKRFAAWVQQMSQTSPETLKFVTILAGLAAIVGPIVIGIGLLVSAIGSILGVFGSLFGMMSGGTVLFGKLAASVAALWPIIAGGAKIALGALSAILGWPVLLGVAIGALGALIYTFWDDIVAYAKSAWEYIKGLWPGLAETLEAVWSAIAAGATAAWEGIKAGISGAWEFIKSIFTSSPGEVWQTILAAADAVWEGLKTGAGSTWEFIKAGFSAIPDALGWVWNALGRAAEGVWGFLAESFSGVFDSLVDAARLAWDRLSGFWSNIKSAAVEAWSAVEGQASDIWDGIAASFGGVADGVAGLMAGLADSVRSKWSNLLSESERFALDLVTPWQRAENQIVSIWQRIVRAIDAQLRTLERSIAALVARLVAQINRLLAAAARARAAASGGGGGGSEPAFAGGGYVHGPGTATSDSILARLSNGEFVIRAAAVKHYGPQLLAALNAMKLPKNFPGFNLGGLVDGFRQSMASLGGGGLPRFAAGGLAITGNNSTPGKSFDLHIDGQVFRGLIAPDDVASAMQSFAGKRGRASAGRKPGWFR